MFRESTLLATLCLVCLFASGRCRAEIRVGLAKADITPPTGGLTTGYSSAQPTDGIYDPVTARVIVLASASETLAMVVCDLCVYNSENLHSQMAELGVDRLLLMNTHTHAGPKMDQMDFPSVEEPWHRTVDQRIVAAIRQAQESMFVGYFAAAETSIQLGYNRLVHRGEYSVTYFENPDRIPYGMVDPHVGVIRISDESGKTRAVLVSYACHPVVLGPRNVKISSDFPGVMRSQVEQSLDEDAMCVFVQGGAGDINPLFLARGDDREMDFAVVEAMGSLLAVEVQRALSFLEGAEGRSDSFKSESSVTEFRHRFEADAKLTLGVTSVLINDDIGIVTMPGEPFHKFQKDLRQASDLPHMYLFGYCCNAGYEWPSYLPDLVSAGRGGYGASDATRAEVGCGERLVNEGLVQLFRLQGKLKPEPVRHTFEVEPK